MNLYGELARGGNDNGERRIDRTVGRGGGGQQTIEQRNEESRGLAGARLCLARHVAAGEGDRQGLRLNGRGAGETLLRETALDGVRGYFGIQKKLNDDGGLKFL